MSNDTQVLTDIMGGLLKIGVIVVEDLTRLLPSPDEHVFGEVSQHLAELMLKLDTQPEVVLAQHHYDQLESLLVTIWLKECPRL